MKLSSTFLWRALTTQVSFNSCHILGSSEAFYWRGRCYMAMMDYKRGLYDFSVAIRAEQKKEAKASDQQAILTISHFYMYAGLCNYMLG